MWERRLRNCSTPAPRSASVGKDCIDGFHEYSVIFSRATSALTAGVRMADRIGDETLCKTRDFIRGEAHVARRDDRARATVPPRARRASAGTLRIRSMHRFEVYDLIFRSGKRIQDAGGNHALGTAHSEKLRR